MFCKVLYIHYVCIRNETKSKIMNHINEHKQASLIHLSALLGFLIPFGSILFTLVFMESK